MRFTVQKALLKARRCFIVVSNFVTVGMDKIVFKKSIRQGTILCFDSKKIRVGTTSVEYIVDVTREEITTGLKEVVFTTRITFVSVDEYGIKKPICTPRQRPKEGM